MPQLHIALHDGFHGHHVMVTVDGRVVFDRKGVSTDLRISRADAVDVDTAAQRAHVTVASSPAAGKASMMGSVLVDVAVTPFLAVDLRPDGTLSITPAGEPFIYL